MCYFLALLLPPLRGFGSLLWPPPPGPFAWLLIDTDAANEIDDLYALALAIGNPERFHLEGIVAAHFGDSGGSRGIDKSMASIEQLMAKAGMSGKFPVKRGSDPFQYADRAPASEGVDFIIERALQATPADPLWLVLLGPATDAAAALIKEPKIADRMIVFWHGRTQWPLRCWNFNATNDIRAARFLFDIQCRFVLFDTGTYLTAPMEETQRRFLPLGSLGAYLHEFRKTRPGFQSPNKGFFDLGDIAALVDPGSVRFEVTAAPTVEQDLHYDFTRKKGDIVRIYFVERDRTFDLLEQALRRVAAMSK